MRLMTRSSTSMCSSLTSLSVLTTSACRLASRSRRHSTARSIIDSAAVPIVTSRPFSSVSWSSKCLWIVIRSPLSETPGDVAFRLLVPRAGEDHLRFVELHQLPQPHEAAVVRGPRGLLHVVRHDHDG